MCYVKGERFSARKMDPTMDLSLITSVQTINWITRMKGRDGECGGMGWGGVV